MRSWLRPDTSHDARDASVRAYWIGLAALALVAILVRVAYPLADPPWHARFGIVWHDEGAWTHNARNMALFGVWEMDRWNPMYLAPVFTGLEYVSFRAFGVGLWQARLVSEILGVLSVLWLAGALRRSVGRAAGLFGASLLATNYVWVIWNRSALLETTMVAFMVAALYAYARAHAGRRWLWGLAAGTCAMLAFFAKAAAAFFLVALAAEASWAAWLAWRDARAAGRRWRPTDAGTATLVGLSVAGIVALAIFVVPYWQEFRFYNWQMSVTRKPAYTLGALVDRASWFPVLHDFFTRMWLMLLLATGAAFSLAVRWRGATPVERLAVAWIALGVTELILHDVGNERRLVFLIPPLALLAASMLARDRRLLAEETVRVTRRRLVAAIPIVLYTLYVLTGSVTRLAFLYEIQPSVWAGASAAAALGALLYATWPRPAAWLARHRWPLAASIVLAALMLAGDAAQFVQWASMRTYVNHDAMLAVGRWLPPGTLVHGKLANGLALESAIKPVFVGRGFGNYDDRLQRDDIRYLLTYTRPSFGYEGPVIRDVLAASRWRIVRRFRVAESTSGDDEAALLEKMQSPHTADGRIAPR